MNSENFKNELIEKCIKDYNIFCDFQKFILEIFDITHSILKNNGIQYFAIYGTLLGIYRDKNIIPWDYDFDLLISIDDSKDVCEILNKTLPKEYYVVSNYNDDTFPYYQIRVCKKGYNHLLHVDIFYYIPSPNKVTESIKYIKNLKRLFDIRKIKKSNNILVETSNNSLINKIIKFFIKYSFLTNSKIDDCIENTIRKYNISNSEYVYIYNHLMNKLKISDLGVPKLIIFDNHEIYVPENIENVLNCLYKNFNEYPTFDTRYYEYCFGLKIIKDKIFNIKHQNNNYRKNN